MKKIKKLFICLLFLISALLCTVFSAENRAYALGNNVDGDFLLRGFDVTENSDLDVTKFKTSNIMFTDSFLNSLDDLNVYNYNEGAVLKSYSSSYASNKIEDFMTNSSSSVGIQAKINAVLLTDAGVVSAEVKNALNRTSSDELKNNRYRFYYENYESKVNFIRAINKNEFKNRVINSNNVIDDELYRDLDRLKENNSYSNCLNVAKKIIDKYGTHIPLELEYGSSIHTIVTLTSNNCSELNTNQTSIKKELDIALNDMIGGSLSSSYDITNTSLFNNKSVEQTYTSYCRGVNGCNEKSSIQGANTYAKNYIANQRSYGVPIAFDETQLVPIWEICSWIMPGSEYTLMDAFEEKIQNASNLSSFCSRFGFDPFKNVSKRKVLDFELCISNWNYNENYMIPIDLNEYYGYNLKDIYNLYGNPKGYSVAKITVSFDKKDDNKRVTEEVDLSWQRDSKEAYDFYHNHFNEVGRSPNKNWETVTPINNVSVSLNNLVANRGIFYIRFASGGAKPIKWYVRDVYITITFE